jgi:hypothetical protein
VYGAAEAVALGYNALLFEGPGQGSMLFHTAAAGGRFHDAPMAPQRRNQVLFDWLARVL